MQDGSLRVLRADGLDCTSNTHRREVSSANCNDVLSAAERSSIT